MSINKRLNRFLEIFQLKDDTLPTTTNLQRNAEN